MGLRKNRPIAFAAGAEMGVGQASVFALTDSAKDVRVSATANWLAEDRDIRLSIHKTDTRALPLRAESAASVP